MVASISNRSRFIITIMDRTMRIFGLLLMMLMPFAASAQVRFGYYNQDSVLHAMPDYAEAKQAVADLREKYEAEMQHSANEFSRKYEDFLDGQKDFAAPILRKRQAELQELYASNMAFREETIRLLDEMEKDVYSPVINRMSEAVRQLGKKHGFAFILRSDNGSLPYVDEGMGVDITSELISVLK